MYPKVGPRSGGTVVTIEGTSLDAGDDIAVNIGGVECHIDRLVL